MSDYSKVELKIDPDVEAGGELYREAIRLANAGLFQQAISLAERIVPDRYILGFFRDDALSRIVARLADANEFDLASSTITRIKSVDFASYATLAVVRALVKAENRDKAACLAQSIQDPGALDTALKLLKE